MSWLSRILKRKSAKAELEHTGNESGVSKEESVVRNMRITQEDQFVGIDHDYIDLFHFRDATEKRSFVSDIESILDLLEIRRGMDYVQVNKKLLDYSEGTAKKDRPRLIETLLFENVSFSRIVESDGKENVVERRSGNQRKGRDKIRSFYDALSFSRINLLRKLEHGENDFEFEEKLIFETLENSSKFNQVRIQAWFELGNAYMSVQDYSKMDSVLEKIRSEDYHLSPASIANFYRQIGEIYVKLGKDKMALSWFKDGLKIHPKLGVKKLISEIEARV